MHRPRLLAALIPVLLVLGCGPSQEDIDAQINQAVSEALEAAEEPEDDQHPNLIEITGMDVGQYLIDNLDGVELEMPSRYFSAKDCEPLELGSVFYGNTDSECNRAVELGEVAVVEYATVLTAEKVANRSVDEDMSEFAADLEARLGPRIYEDRFLLRWDGCDGQSWSRGDCEYLVEDGTVAESERLFREFLGA
ncbi:hypothetical protein [Nocardiopsis valliformis]|uniref:hypothetical protein n=1 Tax=Nocardiopsis valliformis TaxID=239974 RepID=UPI00034D6667|nr:hypothetical protein [Nocardiopsis valliformis]